MKLVYLTTDDPIYLPAFFERVLQDHAADTLAVYAAPPLYRRQTPAQAAWRYARTFGLGAALGLTKRLAAARVKGQSIAEVCRRHRVPYAPVRDVNAPEFLDQLRRQGPELLVSVSCPQLFKRPLIDLPTRGILNIHGAILPHYRGVLPSFWMLANGERQAGVSIYYVDERLDAGDLCGQRIYDILPGESLDGFLRRSKAIAAELLIEVLGQVAAGQDTRRPLDLAAGSYYSWPDRDAVRRFRAQGRSIW